MRLSKNDEIERKSWLFATIIMALLAISVFFVQHFITQIFDFTVEISVFYVPALLLAISYLVRRSQKFSR
jgi:positive regulator of sigma E activity